MRAQHGNGRAGVPAGARVGLQPRPEQCPDLRDGRRAGRALAGCPVRCGGCAVPGAPCSAALTRMAPSRPAPLTPARSMMSWQTCDPARRTTRGAASQPSRDAASTPGGRARRRPRRPRRSARSAGAPRRHALCCCARRPPRRGGALFPVKLPSTPAGRAQGACHGHTLRAPGCTAAPACAGACGTHKAPQGPARLRASGRGPSCGAPARADGPRLLVAAQPQAGLPPGGLPPPRLCLPAPACPCPSPLPCLALCAASPNACPRGRSRRRPLPAGGRAAPLGSLAKAPCGKPPAPVRAHPAPSCALLRHAHRRDRRA